MTDRVKINYPYDAKFVYSGSTGVVPQGLYWDYFNFEN